jgi:cysteine desulfurase/selenocysteine lyase
MSFIGELQMDNFNIDNIRKDFPILSREVNGKPLVYLDNAATTHKPIQVLAAMRKYYEEENANPHRGAHKLSVLATEAYEGTREKVKQFIGADSSKEIIFTKNATEALNLIAYSYGLNFLEPGDEVLLSITEHHSNLVPWQRVAKKTGAILKYMYIDEGGRIPLSEVESKLNKRTKIVGIGHMSNALGTIHPVKKIAELAHKFGAVVIVDGAQSIPHMKIDVKDLDADFFVFSGHKMLGPMGIGVLYGKEAILDKMPPFLSGGDMIEYVTEQETTFAELPFKFEAGTQNVGGAVGLLAAIDYIEKIGYPTIQARERLLTKYALERLTNNPYVTIHGPKDLENRGGVISFSLADVHPHDLSSIVDNSGVALRAGHHCAQPLMAYLKVPGTSRISFYFYNTKEEIDIFIEALKNAREVLGYGS